MEVTSLLLPAQSGCVSPDSVEKSLDVVPSTFVLCRDKDGRPTAIYGDDVWNFNPYRTTKKRLNNIDFNTVPATYVGEVKKLLFHLMYFVQGGRTGRLGAGTLVNHFYEIRSLACFADRLSDSQFVGRVSVAGVLSNASYMRKYIHQEKSSPHQITHFTSFYSAMSRVHKKQRTIDLDAKEYVGKLKKTRVPPKQHLVIPPRLYRRLLDEIDEVVESVYPYLGRLESFIDEFSDKYYGLSKSAQYIKAGGSENLDWLRDDTPTAVEKHGLEGLLTGELEVKNAPQVEKALGKIQAVMKDAIHIYTGMRSDETRAMEYESLQRKPFQAVPGVDREDIVSIVSSTTKYHGYRAKAGWLAPDQVVRAVEILEAIARPLERLWGVDGENRNIFISPNVVKMRQKSTDPDDCIVSGNARYAYSSQVVEEEDVEFLREIEPGRDFEEDGVVVGRAWPFRSHQGRRSLAFYGAASGVVSSLTIKRQFKHVSLDLARYYGAGHENIAMLLGRYDEENEAWVMPADHVSDEYRLAVPAAQANALVALIVGGEGRLFGSAGAYIEKQRKGFTAGVVNISEVRAKTEKRVKDGELAYRETMLGGCMKVGPCEAFVFGRVTECIFCESSVIQVSRVPDVIQMVETDLTTLEKGSAEYRIAIEEREALAKLERNVIAKSA